jgi:hypothetical protein
VLHALGVDPAFAEAVLGDLAEEYAVRAACDVNAARQWYAGQVVRSTPHLLWRATRHHDGRARLAVALAGAAFVASVVMAVLLSRAGPPARLVAGTRDTVLVNYLRPVSLPMRVHDAAGRPLPDTGVRYAWVTGAPVFVSSRGVVTCARPGDATVHASLGPLATNLLVRCRPVREVRVDGPSDFVLGDPARDLAVQAIGPDGRPVTMLGARLRVEDSTVATLDGLRVRPLSAGETMVELLVGDRRASAMVRVFEPVRSLEGLRPEQRLVVAPVRLTRGTFVRWPLPTGRFFLSFLPGPDAEAAPTLSVDGAVMCMPALEPGVYNTRCLVRESGAWVTVAYPSEPVEKAATSVVAGALALHRDRPDAAPDLPPP